MPVKWTPEKIKEEALKYETRGEFYKNAGSAAAAARRLAIMEEACSHMKEASNKPWSEDEIRLEAIKFNTKTEFSKKSSGAYHAAIRMDLIETVCSHMVSGRNLPRKWNKEKIEKEAKKYTNRTNFRIHAYGAYEAAGKFGILDLVCAHMVKPESKKNETVLKKRASLNNPIFKTNGEINIEVLKKEALAFNTPAAFNRSNPTAYYYTRKLGLQDYVFSHMSRRKIRKWRPEEIETEALKYKSRKDFERGNSGAYKAASSRGILDKVCSHMARLKVPNGYWNEETLKNEASKYKTKIEFKNNSHGAYQAAHKLGIIDIVCESMNPVNSPPGYWDVDRVLSESIKFDSVSDFKKNSPRAYKVASNNNWIQKVCSHMNDLRLPKGFWTFEKVIQEAIKFESRFEFQRYSYGAYISALKNGWLDEVCSHMQKPEFECDSVYIWKAQKQYFNGELVYKIGITRNVLQDYRIKQVARAHGFTPVDIVMHQVDNPREVEKHLLTFGYNPQYIGDGSTEFRALSDAEYKEAIAYLESCAIELAEEAA